MRDLWVIFKEKTLRFITMSEQNNISIAHSEIISEWLYFAILAEHTSDSINQLIELTLASTFLEQPIISEAEINAAIEMDLDLQKQTSNPLSDDEFRQSANREAIKQELIEAGAGEQFEEGIAACEFLAALFGNPSDGFLAIINSYGEEFTATFQQLNQLCKNGNLRTLSPTALAVIKQAKSDEHIKSMELNNNDATNWKNTLSNLERNLTI